MNKNNRLILIVLDGWGINSDKVGNATLQAKLPFFNNIFANYPSTLITGSSEMVGLTPHEMGNSEVGHLNIGAGRVVWQDLALISRSIKNGDFFDIPILKNICSKSRNLKLHLIGLVSDGGVHSHIDHLLALLEMARKEKVKNVVIHMITDGRDTSPQCAKKYLLVLGEALKKYGGKIATISGRYYAMDRDKRFDRTQKAIDAIVKGIGRNYNSPLEAINDAYKRRESDEFIIPSVILENNQPVARIENNDGVIFFNFRSDRTRQLMHSIVKSKNHLNLVSMTRYEKNQEPVKVVFEKSEIKNCLAEVISRNNLKQLHTAETEKYAHVTYFLNGGREEPFPGEDRIMVPSPKVATYDMKPEMSAYKISKNVIKNIGKYDFMVINFANADMVGHTGDLKASIKALEAIDKCLAAIASQAEKFNYNILITADHGNAEELIDTATQKINKEHSINPVPIILITKNNKLINPKTLTQMFNQSAIGILADISPTVLDIMNLTKPKEMTGISLLNSLQ